MTLKVRPNTEKPEEKRTISALIYEKLLVFGCIEGDIFEGDIKCPWSRVTSWLYESDLIEYMKGGAGAT